jgi:hypothetical protein
MEADQGGDFGRCSSCVICGMTTPDRPQAALSCAHTSDFAVGPRSRLSIEEV